MRKQCKSWAFLNQRKRYNILASRAVTILFLTIGILQPRLVAGFNTNTCNVSTQQQEQYIIKGRIIGSDRKAVGWATIRVTKQDSPKIISTAVADSSGRFNLIVHEQGEYKLAVFAIGMDSLIRAVTVSDSKTIELNDIIIKTSTTELNAVVITAQKRLIKQEADRIIYDLQADPQSKGSTVLDMMRKVPYLSVDGNENILFNGSTGYRIFINGKPSAMVEKHPKDVLRSIPASTIKSIEVITTPPSKYDAEGLAGIINIVTIKEIDNGYHGSININQKWPGGPGAGGALTLKQGKFGLSAIGGISYNKVPETSGEITRTTTGENITNLNQFNYNKSDNQTWYSGLEASYELDTLNLISAQFNWSNSSSKGVTIQTSVLTGTDTMQYRLTENRKNNGQGVDASANYQRGFRANKDQLLTLSYRYMRTPNSFLSNVGLSDQVNYSNYNYRQTNEENFLEHTIQADYAQPIGALKMEGGIKGIFRKNNSDFQYLILNPEKEVYELDDTRSNIFNNRQDVFAAYNSYEYGINKWWFRAGFRAEQTIIQGEGSSQVKQKYLNLLPSIIANQKFNDKSSVTFTYSKRIQRPAIAQLNAFVNRSNPDFQTTGNPALKPITSDKLQLSYFQNGKATFEISLGYLFFSRVINQISTFDPVSKVTMTRYENFGKGNVAKINVFFRYPITPNWSISWNGDFRRVTFATFENIYYENTGFMAYNNISSSLSLKRGWKINGDFTKDTGGVSGPQGNTNGFIATSLSANKSILNDKLTLSAAVNNPFSEFRYVKNELTGLDFNQTNDYQVYYRRFMLAVNYTFGKLKGKIKKNKRGIKNDDLSSN